MTTLAVGATHITFCTSEVDPTCGFQPGKDQGTQCLLHSRSRSGDFFPPMKLALRALAGFFIFIFWSGFDTVIMRKEYLVL